MDFSHSPKIEELRGRLESFMNQHVYPADRAYHELAARHIYPLEIIEPLKREARARGLWNLFLPSLAPDEPGTALSHVEYAPLAEVMGRVPWASEVFNCSPPDTGNMEVLHRFAT